MYCSSELNESSRYTFVVHDIYMKGHCRATCSTSEVNVIFLRRKTVLGQQSMMINTVHCFPYVKGSLRKYDKNLTSFVLYCFPYFNRASAKSS